MRSAPLLLALLGVALAAPRPQDIDLDGVNAADDPVFIAPPMDVASNTPSLLTTTSVEPIAAPTAVPTDSKKRSPDKIKRDGTCNAQPTGAGPPTSPDTVSAYLSNTAIAAAATNALTPAGYAQVFVNLQASLSASNYMGLHTLTTYNPALCQSKCDQASGCVAFNLYMERDPSVDPNAANCPNPPSTNNIKCTLWGAPISASEAKNTGQWRDSFRVVIAGSNGYNKNSPPPAISGFTGPVEFGGAINAPVSSGSYMGYQYFPFSQTQGFDPNTCAAACTSQTQYNEAHPSQPCGAYQPCVFFNAYVLSEDGVPQGLYCSLYNATWGPSYGNNYGQYRGSDYYSVSDSYGYSVSPVPVQPAYGSC